MLTYKSLSGHEKGSYRQSRQYIRLDNINLIIYFKAVGMQDKKPIFWKVFKKQMVLVIMYANERKSKHLSAVIQLSSQSQITVFNSCCSQKASNNCKKKPQLSSNSQIFLPS